MATVRDDASLSQDELGSSSDRESLDGEERLDDEEPNDLLLRVLSPVLDSKLSSFPEGYAFLPLLLPDIFHRRGQPDPALLPLVVCWRRWVV